jgi:hypothetical protein
MNEEQSPKVFISYSWDGESHREWVRELATRLRTEDGVDVKLDCWETVPGDQLLEFMEQAVQESDYVLCICAPRYKEKFDRRSGGVGYEGDIMTGEVFVSRYQRKFIPIFRKGEWKEAAPSWLLGKYYVDMRGDPYSENSYQDLVTTLHGEHEEAPPIGKNRQLFSTDEDASEFVNREIELATLDPAKLAESYWQCALVSSPTGYGKTRLLNRLTSNIQENSELKNRWNCCYIDLKDCDDLDNVSDFFSETLTGEKVLSDSNEDENKKKSRNHILNKMSISSEDGPPLGVLIIIDSIEYLEPISIEWFSSLIHEVIVSSYIDYELGEISSPVRFILSGLNPETFWNNYLSWEESSKAKYRLLPPKNLPLSAFDKLAVQELVSRRSKKTKIHLEIQQITNISYELQYLSGGHPQVVSEILNELVTRKFRQYKNYLQSNRSGLVKKHISKVAKKILFMYPISQAQRDIKTICVFRLININTLRKLLSEKLISSQVETNNLESYLGSLCKNNVLSPPNAEKLFYHDDIIRRILYLDLAFGHKQNKKHIQDIHKCAKDLYREWIDESHGQYSVHHFLVEWLFHSLQIENSTRDEINLEWETLLTSIQIATVSQTDLRRAIREIINADSEFKYLFRERFNSEDLSPLFEF